MKKKFLSIVFLLLGCVVYGQDGILDPDFGINGRKTFYLGDSLYFNFMAFQGDGKMILTGTVNRPGNIHDIYIARLKQDFTLDPSFGYNGINVLHFNPIRNDHVTGLAIQSDGKIVVVAYSYFPGPSMLDFQMAVARFKPDGIIDSSFADYGKKLINPDGTRSNVYAVAIQDDGKIIMAGGSGNNTYGCMVRLNTNGTLDNSFGNSGVFMTPSTDDFPELLAVRIASDHKIIGMHRVGGFGPLSFAATRINPNGTLDNTFGNGGRASIAMGTQVAASLDMLVQQDGKVVIAGSVFDIDHERIALTRMNSDGTPDNSFGTAGKVFTGFNAYAELAYRIVLQQPDNKIVVAGMHKQDGPTGNYDYRVLRYHTNGSLDNSFGNGGSAAVEDFDNANDNPTGIFPLPGG